MWFTGHKPSLPCGRCLKKSPPWSALVAVDDYVPPLSRLIHALKFSGQSSLAQPLARLLLLAVLQARRTAHCRKSTWW
jgi:predicted amidophosphoribosyltransferase